MKYSLRSLTVVKVALLGAIAALSGWYIFLIVNWGTSRHYAAPYFLAYVILAVATAATAGAALLLLTPQNFQRTITSTAIILTSTVLGWFFGDPMAQGSYDHGGGESEIGWLTGGIIGALLGWVAMTAWGYQYDPPTHDTADKLPSSDVPTPPTTP